MLRFEVHNLLEPLREPPFDLIILKNVLIYFDAESKRKTLENVRRMLRPGGSIITGPADGASEFLKDFQSSQGWLHRAAAATKVGK
jgi:chemotaxis protein methyltransferase CheR